MEQLRSVFYPVAIRAVKKQRLDHPIQRLGIGLGDRSAPCRAQILKVGCQAIQRATLIAAAQILGLARGEIGVVGGMCVACPVTAAGVTEMILRKLAGSAHGCCSDPQHRA